MLRRCRPLNSIGMPYYTTPLLSGWTSQFMSPKLDYPPPTKIPPQILSTMKKNDNVLWAALPKEFKGRRNMVVVGSRKDQGRFRSGKPRKSDVSFIFSISDNHLRSYRVNPIRLLLTLMATMCRGYTVRWRLHTPSSELKTLTLG
jgi:hypothetical protein